MVNDVFHCPGETQPISRSMHMGRLASFFPACRNCPQRHETGALGKSQVKRLQLLAAPKSPLDFFTDEAIVGIHRNQLWPPEARRIAAALASYVRERLGPTSQLPAVVLAGDARPLTPELIAAAGEGLRMHGCRVIDIGATTAQCVALAIHEFQADGGLLVGNPTSEPHRVGLAFWGPGGTPISGVEAFDDLRERLARAADRPTRSSGPLERRQIEATYLARLADYFHALRPLRLVVDSGCRPLVRYLKQLATNVGCEIDYVQDQPRVAQIRSHRPASQRTSTAQVSPGSERLPALGGQVQARGAHFGIWIDGNGEVCRIVDERGQAVPSERLLPPLAKYLLADRPSHTIVVEREMSPRVVDALRGCGATVVTSGHLRSQMHEAMTQSAALCGGGPSGRYWFGAPLPCPDALRTLALILTVLSQSDRPLSEVVA